MDRILFGLLMGIALLAQSQQVVVMTYNIRLDNSGDGVNQWKNRKEKISNQLHFYEPDILGIQEGLPNQVRYLDEALTSYDYIGVGRADGVMEGEFSAIYFKSDQFILDIYRQFFISSCF